MKKTIFAVAAVAALLSTTACNDKIATHELADEQDSLSYALGTLIGRSIAEQSKQMFPTDTVDLKVLAKALAGSKANKEYLTAVSQQLDTIYGDIFMMGMCDQLANGVTMFPQEMCEVMLNKKAQTKREEMQRKREEEKARNTEEQKSFFESNAKQEGVVTTESGLQYKELQKGSGESVKKEDKVLLKYRGTLLDGTVFDENDSAEMRVSGVIPGFSEALQLMSKGSKMEVYIPAELGYGERGAGAKIGPNQALIFNIEVLDIIQPAKK